MSTTLKATFETRRQAELAVERLVQEFNIDRRAIIVGPDGGENSVGAEPSGGDLKAAAPSVEARDDAPVEGRIVVSVDPAANVDVAAVRKAFEEFDGQRA